MKAQKKGNTNRNLFLLKEKKAGTDFVAWLNDVRKPNKIQSAFIAIVSLLTRALLILPSYYPIFCM